jgi:hypothetical protein
VLEIDALPAAGSPGPDSWPEAVARAVPAGHGLPPDIRLGLSLTFRMPAEGAGGDLAELVGAALGALTGSIGTPLAGAGPGHPGEGRLPRDRVDSVEAHRRTVRGTERPGVTVEVFDLP